MMAQPVILATQEAEIQRVTIQKPAQANTLWHPISKNPSQKKGRWSGSRCGPWVQALVLQKKKKKSERKNKHKRTSFCHSNVWSDYLTPTVKHLDCHNHFGYSAIP
jgi:hypothetical protein